MYPADFIFLTSIADFENALLDYDPSNPNLWEIVAKAIEGTSAFTMPQIVEKLMRKLIGFEYITWKKITKTENKLEKINIAKDINSLLKDKFTICMMSNSNLFHGKTAIAPTHWIVIEEFTILGDDVQFECFTWGRIEPCKVSLDIFFSNNFGFYVAK
jgi:hypothetical protein